MQFEFHLWQILRAISAPTKLYATSLGPRQIGGQHFPEYLNRARSNEAGPVDALGKRWGDRVHQIGGLVSLGGDLKCNRLYMAAKDLPVS